MKSKSVAKALCILLILIIMTSLQNLLFRVSRSPGVDGINIMTRLQCFTAWSFLMIKNYNSIKTRGIGRPFCFPSFNKAFLVPGRSLFTSGVFLFRYILCVHNLYSNSYGLSKNYEYFTISTVFLHILVKLYSVHI